MKEGLIGPFFNGEQTIGILRICAAVLKPFVRFVFVDETKKKRKYFLVARAIACI